MSENVEQDERGGTNRVHLKGYVPDVLLASLNLLGPGGSVLAGALGGFWTSKRLANIESTIKAMGERLSSVEVEQIRGELESDGFVQLVLTTMQNAQIEHREEKRKAYGRMLANMAMDSKTEYEQKSMFVSFLSEIEIVHVNTLKYLQSKSEGETAYTRWATLEEIKGANANLSANSTFVTVAVLQKLASYGLIKSRGDEKKLMTGVNPVGLWFHAKFMITEYGEKFITFLKG